MEQKLFPLAVGVAWLALPLTALHYLRAWDRLPARMAVHFDVNWRPNGWTSREGALMLVLITTILPLVTFTVAAYVVSRRAAVSNLSKWAMVAVFYIALGVVYFVNNWVIDRNLNAGPTPFSKLLVFDDWYGNIASPQVNSAPPQS